jgi:hypothetical protein
MPDDLVDRLEESGLTLEMLEDGLSEEIANTVSDMLPADTEINDCYPTGWSI